jgi:predicted dehydrogenase
MVDLVLIGAGARGKDAYGKWIKAHGGEARLVAAADPDAARLSACASEHGLPPELLFSSWEELLDKPRMAMACIVATQDQGHTAPALAAMAKGYQVLLEKPMAPSPEECRVLVRGARDAGVELRICHVLRYTPFFSAMKRSIDSGEIGEIVAINHSENVAYWHFAHSYVRGNWRKALESNPLLLAKSCHDMDILSWLASSRATSIQSFGSLSFYTRENAPEGAPERCLDGCPAAESCPWYAPRLYLHGAPLIDCFRHSPSALLRLAARVAGSAAIRNLVDWRDWPSSTISDDHSRAGRLEALRAGPYGRCVFRCDNDVVDRQVVNTEFESGAVASFSLHGHSYQEGRRIRVDGTKGCLEGSFGLAGSLLRLHEHRSGRTRTLLRKADLAGHGGGDAGLMESFIADLEARQGGERPPDSRSSAVASLESHLMCFAAEESRRTGTVLPIQRFPECS